MREPQRAPETFLLSGYAVTPVRNSEEFLEPLIPHDAPVPKKSRRPLWITLTTIILVIFVGLGIAGFAGLFSMRVILTNSMEPTIMPGDVVVTVSDRLMSPHVGDVVVYVGKTFEGTPVAPFAHRIIGGNAESGWVVKGDNNPDADVQQPTADDIESVVVGVIPWVGKFLNVQVLIILVVVIFGIWLIVDGVRDRK